MQTTKKIILVILLHACCVMTPFPVWAVEEAAPATIDALREQIHAMEQEAAALEEENRGLMKMLKETEDDDVYLVVDTENNRLTMRQGNKILLTAVDRKKLVF
jgi:seryl-tRNA synthetase